MIAQPLSVSHKCECHWVAPVSKKALPTLLVLKWRAADIAAVRMTLKVFGDDVVGANISTLRRRVDALHMDNKEMKFKE